MTGITVDFSNRTVLVTGASSGLGSHFAQLLADAGASVVLAARRIDRLEALCEAIKSSGGKAAAVTMDVTREASVITAFDEAERAFGPVDSVIANAGVNVEGPAFDIPESKIDDILAANVKGAFLTAREAAKRMIANGSVERAQGRIVMISSITATAISPGLSLYSASKAAVSQMTRVLARDWVRKGVNINAICPGYIETDINAAWFQTDAGKKQIASWPRSRLMSAPALDPIMLYLLSDASAETTGGTFTVDDGQTL